MTTPALLERAERLADRIIHSRDEGCGGGDERMSDSFQA